MSIENDLLWLEKKLVELNLNHLKCTKRGESISVFSKGEMRRENRCRFNRIERDRYTLDMANHSGKWEATPFGGTIQELVGIVAETFPWTLEDYAF